MNYFAVWTESLYGVLFIWLLIWLRKEKEYQKAFWIIVLVILLCLTRMVGVVVAGSLLLAYSIDKRPLRGLQIFVSGSAVIVIWTMLGALYLGATARTLGFIEFNAVDLLYLATEFGGWITPFSGYSFIPMILGSALLLVPFFYGLKAWRNRREKGVLFWFLIVHFYAYISFVVLSKVMLDASIAYDVRTLFPLMINFAGILILMQTDDVLDQNTRSQIRFIFPKLIMLIVILNVFGLWHLRNSGLGYNSKEWQEYQFPEEIGKVSSSLVFTNDYAPIYLYGERIQHSVLMPQKKDLYSLEPYREYEAGFDLMVFSLEQSVDGKIIWVRNGITGPVYPTYEELKEHENLKVIYDDWLCLILEPKNYLVESDDINVK